MTEKNNGIQRFSNRVENYIKYRPSYPSEIISFLKHEINLSSDQIIADIGSGTGISSVNFLKNNNKVIGIEPNSEMRKASEIYLNAYDNFISIDGKSDNTSLQNSSIDIIIAGQAFHWFNIETTKIEFKRILKNDGYIILIWNEKDFSKPFMSDYEKFIKKFGTDYDKVKQENIDKEILDGFYTNGYKVKEFYNNQIFDFDGVKGRLFSSSYIPLEDNKINLMTNELKELFDKYKNNEKINFEYITKLYYGKL
jgi:ubiquinone/menaquinone biosynthesis C-methylase UbiE